jgi:hypothetical protein
MENRKLTHELFWARMDHAARHVEKLPDWVKGSPCNERRSTSNDDSLPCGARHDLKSGANVKDNPHFSRP